MLFLTLTPPLRPLPEDHPLAERRAKVELQVLAHLPPTNQQPSNLAQCQGLPEAAHRSSVT